MAHLRLTLFHAETDAHGGLYLIHIFLGKLSETVGQTLFVNGAKLLEQDNRFAFQKITVNKDMGRLRSFLRHRSDGGR